MTDENKIDRIILSLTQNALGDIKRASSGGSKMGAFILCSCLIDTMAGFEKGSDTTQTDYINFVQKRLTSYNATSLYKDLRCKLVHSYSEGGSYLFVDDQAAFHGQSHASKQIINLENFIADITSALNAFSADIKGLDPSLRSKAIARYDVNGIIAVQSAVVPTIVTGSSTANSIPLSGR